MTEQQKHDYDKLYQSLLDSLYQAQHGKGQERHAENNEPFENQIMLEVTRRLEKSPVAGCLFQAVKKVYETTRLDYKAAIEELHGATIYIHGAILRLHEIMERKDIDANKTA